MLLGYNHNINYKGMVFHIQTEDSGVKNPHVITLLYRDGIILSSKKTSYADILQMENLEAVVEDLMKEQHKDMLRRLKNGEFDGKAFGTAAASSASTKIETESASSPAVPEAPSGSISPQQQSDTTGIGLLFQETVQTSTETTRDKAPEPEKKEKAASLDDAILNFFGAGR